MILPGVYSTGSIIGTSYLTLAGIPSKAETCMSIDDRTIKYHILNDIEVEIDDSALLKRAMVKPGTPIAGMALEFAKKATHAAHPKAMYAPIYIDERNGDEVVIAGIRFNSRVLSVNVRGGERVFPFAATCGNELDNWSRELSDPLEHYWAETFKGVVLETAVDALRADVEERYKTGKISLMNPGSLENWPIEQQKKLFELLGDTGARIGVELTESYVMVPVMSLSGIMFPSEQSFFSCHLCPREDCPGRRAKYDPALYKNKYGA